jgi:hypothetical protein
MVTAHRLTGPLLTDALTAALRAVVGRHEALRTVFRRVDGEMRQVVLPELHTPVDVVDCSRPGAEAADVVVRERTERPFDLATGPLLRPLLVRLDAEHHLMVLVLHHLVGDGWSLGVVVDEVVSHYRGIASGVPVTPPPPAMQYPDFTLWEREAVSEGEVRRQIAYWRERLHGYVTAPAVLGDRVRPARWDSRVRTTSFTIAADVVEGLEALGRVRGATLYLVVLAAFQAVVGVWSGLDRFVLATASARRAHAALSDLVGLVANIFPVGADLTDDPTFHDLVDRVRRRAVAELEYHDVPVDRLLSALSPVRLAGTPPTLPIGYHLMHADASPLEAHGVRFEPVAAETEHGLRELTLTAVRTDALVCALTWTTAHHDDVTINGLVTGLTELLAEVVRRPDVPVRPLLKKSATMGTR